MAYITYVFGKIRIRYASYTLDKIMYVRIHTPYARFPLYTCAYIHTGEYSTGTGVPTSIATRRVVHPRTLIIQKKYIDRLKDRWMDGWIDR